VTEPAIKDASAKIEAEDYYSFNAVELGDASEGTQKLTNIGNGGFALYKNIDFGTGLNEFSARVSGLSKNARIEVKADKTENKEAELLNK
jgi:glucuronoarabinoxylan endo-1,4-beta-xylanase